MALQEKLSAISVQFLKGVGPARKKILANLGVESVGDLMYLFPRRYEDRTHLTPIIKAKIGEVATVSGKILDAGARKSWYTKKHLTEVMIEDESGCLFCVWFNQPYLSGYLKSGRKIICHGKIERYKNRLQMVAPEYELMDEEDDKSLSVGRIVPIYPLTRGITQRYLRKIIDACLGKYKDSLVDELPVNLRNKHKLMNLKRSILNIHFPEAFNFQEDALRRISFEEFYFFQVSVLLRRISITQKKGVTHILSDMDVLKYVNSFAFELTKAQKRVIREIRDDMARPAPMLRLLQGDVGCGKTIIAFFGCLNAFLNGFQSALMAPTEILARQHYENILNLIDKKILPPMRVGFLASSVAEKEKAQLLEDIKNKKVDIVIGTHAIVNEQVVFNQLSFAVIDEQHKFGVNQRALLSEKGNNPDILIMTATPIPRTLCLSLYGDLEVSVIDELPASRKKIKTQLFSFEQEDDVYQMVLQKIKQGRQAYIVYPIIDESESLDLKAAETSFKKLKKGMFKDLRLALVHGQMKRDETENIMRQFKSGELDVLVATSVLEVGIDVPNANVMVIEHADRFGLSSLHQLRGRIGRGDEEGSCLLLADAATEDAQKRLEAILKTTDGFKIAEQDLLIRGPGQFFGRHQHGLNELKVANPVTQIDTLELARAEASALLRDDPRLTQEGNKLIKEVVKRRYPSYLEMVSAG